MLFSEKIHLSKESEDAVILMSIQILNYLIPILTVPYLILKLGANSYGYIGFSFAYVSYFSLIVDFGFGFSATKRMIIGQSLGSNATSVIFSATVYSKLSLFIITLFPFFALPLLINQIRPYLISIYCMFPLLLGQTISLGWYFQSIGKIRVLALISGVSRVIILPLIFVFVNSSKDYYIAALIQSSVYLVSGIISLIYLYINKYLIFRRVKIKHIRKELGESLPLFLSSAATSLYTQLFAIILGFSSSPAIVGIYTAAERLIRTICLAIYTPINQAYFPKISRVALTSRKDALKLTKKLLIFLWIIMGSIGILIFIFAPQISEFIGKNKYPGMDILLRILAFAPLIIVTGGIYGQSRLVAMGNSLDKKHYRNTYWIAGGMAILMITLLAPKMKDIGAAIAVLITEVTVTVTMFYYSKKSKSGNSVLESF